jgi:predicted Zn finger-like uncharacterized protein
MIIICKECSTKFKLDESLLQETGSKVRCCNCKNIFTAYPPQALGKTEVSQPLPSQQGYFDSEESFEQGGPGGLQKSEEEPDDDGLELDVDEDDEDIDEGGLDLGDDEIAFDDGGIDMGGGMPGMDSGMDSGMNFDEDMDTDGTPGMDFDSDSEPGDMELDTEINLNLDQGDEIELDADSETNSAAVAEEDNALEIAPESSVDDDFADESLGDDDVDDDFEFEFELDEEEKLEVEEELTLDEPSLEDEEIDIEDVEPDQEQAQEIEEPMEEDFELSMEEDILEEDIDGEEDFTDLIEDTEEDEDSSQIGSIGFDLDDDALGDEEDDDDYEIEEVDEFEEDDDDYDIEEYEDDDQEFEDDDIIDDEYVNENEESETKPKKARKKPSKLFKVLLAILLLLGVGYGAFMVTGGFTKSIDFSKINFSIVKNLLNFSKMDQIPVWATINNQSLNGRYVNNENTGKLFIITGKITNDSTIPLNHIEVEGTLIAAGGVVAKKKRVFCGNKIPEGQLSSLSVGAINRILQRKDGEQGANLDISAGESIPFMLVFSGLPEELENYTVTVTSFDRMKKK